MNVEKLEIINGGSWLAYACGFGAMTLQASFAFPVLFAVSAPLTVGACAASALDSAIKAGY